MDNMVNNGEGMYMYIYIYIRCRQQIQPRVDMKVLEREDAECYEHLAVCHRMIDPTGLPHGPLLLSRLDQRFRTRTGMKSCPFGTITIASH
jgi:hypothetical protein